MVTLCVIVLLFRWGGIYMYIFAFQFVSLCECVVYEYSPFTKDEGVSENAMEPPSVISVL